jgi:hypothetical protein
MHANIMSNKNISRVLRYHELKVERGVARCVYADNFIKDRADLTLRDKLYHFERLTSLNEQSQQNILHILVQFGFGERMDNDKLANITKEYMEGIGFGKQPYLVYRHDDTRHLHAHIVSTFIRPNGKREGLLLEDYYHSRELTRQLEQKYSLSLSDRATRERIQNELPLQKIKYGEKPLLMSMSKVLEAVVPDYAFTSLSEFNAILRCYNMEASRGKEGSPTWRNSGLIYRPIIESGPDESLYIKASVFKCRPTLKNLEKKFALNEALRQPRRSRLTVAIDWTLGNKTLDLTAFRTALQKDGVSSVLQKDESGRLQNIFYVDWRTKSVFEGAALGSRYSAAGIQERCISEEVYRQQQELKKQRELKLHRGRDYDLSL